MICCTPVEALVKGQNLVSVTTDTSLFEALSLYVEYSVHSLPVIDDGNVMGILTLMDLAKWYKRPTNKICEYRRTILV